MRFITRQLYEQMQDHSPEGQERFEEAWEEATDARIKRIDEILPQLPESMRAFAHMSLHDGTIRDIDLTVPGEVRLAVHGCGSGWGPAGDFLLTFRGVKSTEGLERVLGGTWLYEEVDLHPEARFQYSVLQELNDFSIAADEFALEKLPALDTDEQAIDQAIAAMRHVAQEHGDEYAVLGKRAFDNPIMSGLEWFAHTLGWQWPPSYQEILLKHDGVKVGDITLLSFAESFEQFMETGGYCWHKPRAFWPIARDSSGDIYALSLNERDDAQESPVVFFDREKTLREPVETRAETYATFVIQQMAKQCRKAGCSANAEREQFFL